MMTHIGQGINMTIKEELIEFFANLDDETRASRFAHPVSSYYAVQYIRKNFSYDHPDKYFYVKRDPVSMQIIAVGELHYICDKKAEIAIVVDKDYRCKGLGKEIFADLVNTAKLKGYTDIYSLCLPSNIAMKKLALDNGMQLKYHNGEITGELQVPDRLTFNVIDNFQNYANMILMMERKFITDFYDFWNILIGRK